jgi:predicted ATP-dependent endonuclease of OLD family
MKLLSIRIKNFRSILDSQEIYLASDVTVLAGKNEAGKTILLKALEKFNQGQGTEFNEDDRPADHPGAEPEVKLSFKLDQSDLEEIIDGLNLPNEMNKEAVASIPFEVIKGNNSNYTLSGKHGSIVDLLLNNGLKKRKKTFEKLNSLFLKIKDIFTTNNIPNYPLADIDNLEVEHIKRLDNELLPNIESYSAALPSEMQQTVKDFKDQINNSIGEFNQLTKEYEDNRTRLLGSIPKIVYFEAFDKEDALPFEIEIARAKEHASVKRYCTISGLDLDKLAALAPATQRQLELVNSVSAIIEGDFKDSWKQDKIDLRVQLNGNKLVFAFYEEGTRYPFKMEQRSKGLQWFLAFYLLLKAEVKDHNSIVLIDEPGLFVHAQAQNDILDVLTQLAAENQIILTTHSPYLIDPARLDRIRLVIKDLDKRQNRGTRVFSLSSNQNIDRATLMPIITAIGLDITKQLTIAADHNIILEGISDYYYFQAALKLVPPSLSKKFASVHLIPLTGADNMPPIASLLIGWKLGFHALLDNDEKGKAIKQILSDKLLVSNDNISFVSDNDGYQIEDLISKSDFNIYVLEKEENYEVNKLNSQVIPDSNKAPYSRRFFEKVVSEKIKLSDKTKENLTALLTELAGKNI